MQPWFEKSRTEYDSDANSNKCFNMFPFCGESKNQLINFKKQEIIDRGVFQLLYFVKNEIQFRIQYMIGLDIWHYDKYWANQIIATFVLGSLVFTYVCQKAYKNNKVRKIIANLRVALKIKF